MYTFRHQIASYGKRFVFGTAALMLFLFAPVPYAFAADAADTTSPADTCTPVQAAPSGIVRPTGDDASTYTYDSCTGLWENTYYTWSPATQKASPRAPYMYAYSCDTSSWKWTIPKWIYDPAARKFTLHTVSVANLPAGATIAADSVTNCTPPPPPATPSADTTSTSTDPAAGTTAATAGPDASSNTSTTTNNSTTLNTTSGVVLTNQIGAIALSGSAVVVGNTTGGDATSGDASSMANVLNMLQSSSSLSGATTFVANINGDVQGDLLIDPSLLQPASGSTALNTTNDLTVNSGSNNQINNTINLAATSGDATVANNTTGGNATTGSATAIANVVNMINSMIGANQSFLGVININGNFNGNILVPQSFLDSLIASNAPRTTVTIGGTQTTDVNVANTSTQNITNNVTSTATSGDATVVHNTSGGSATTGTAGTSVTIFNLTGDQVIGTNSLLVFVNVLGKWVGVIMNAPSGTTAAALGGSISQNTANSLNASFTNDDTITNDITVAAQSGDATVRNNTTAGNATSGNASTAVNLMNIDNTQYSLSGWFGVLFINVFGNWFGNFGVNSPAAPTGLTTPGGPGKTHAQPSPSNAPPVFQFVPATTTANDTPVSTMTDTPVNVRLASEVGNVLAASATKPTTTLSSTDVQARHANRTAQYIGGALVVIGLAAIVTERVVSVRRGR